MTTGPNRHYFDNLCRQTHNASLIPELEALVDCKVALGRYRSASEVVRAALRLLDEWEQRIDRGLLSSTEILLAD